MLDLLLPPLYRKLAVAVVALLLTLAFYVTRQSLRECRLELAARPLVEEDTVTEVKRGPVKITREKLTHPDGTVSIRQIREIASEERKTHVEHEEKSAVAVSRKRRYVGVAVDPTCHQKPRIAAGLTFFDRLDFGGAWDTRRGVNDGAFQVEARLRF